jgi:hypothetical protein
MYYKAFLDCDHVGSVTSHSEVNVFILLGEIPIFLFSGNLSISKAFSKKGYGCK